MLIKISITLLLTGLVIYLFIYKHSTSFTDSNTTDITTTTTAGTTTAGTTTAGTTTAGTTTAGTTTAGTTTAGTTTAGTTTAGTTTAGTTTAGTTTAGTTTAGTTTTAMNPTQSNIPQATTAPFISTHDTVSPLNNTNGNDGINYESPQQSEMMPSVTDIHNTNSLNIPPNNIDTHTGGAPSILDLGKSIYSSLGEVNFSKGFSDYQMDGTYPTLPNNLYDNMRDYKNSINSQHNLNGGGSDANIADILDGIQKPIIQRDFEGVSNIFAPNFIFLNGAEKGYDFGLST